MMMLTIILFMVVKQESSTQSHQEISPRWKCSKMGCTEDTRGEYSSYMKCHDECNKMNWSCDNFRGYCVPDNFGPFASKTECDISCRPPTIIVRDPPCCRNHRRGLRWPIRRDRRAKHYR